MFVPNLGSHLSHRTMYIELVVRDRKDGELMSVIVGADTEETYGKVYPSGLGYRGDKLVAHLQQSTHRYVGNLDDVIRPIVRRE